MSDYDHEIKVPMIHIDEAICRKCKGAVKPSVFQNFYECPECKSITSDVIISVKERTAIIKLVVS